MAFWPSRRRRQEQQERAAAAARAYQDQQAAAKRAILDRAARERADRDQAVPPEHRASEAERRETAARWNQATRWYEPAPLTLGQVSGYQPAAALALARTGRRWPW